MQVYEQITPQEHVAEQQAVVMEPHSRAISLTLFQAVLCLLILLAALVLRTLVPPVYDTARSWYDAQMQRSILITDDDLSNR